MSIFKNTTGISIRHTKVIWFKKFGGTICH